MFVCRVHQRKLYKCFLHYPIKRVWDIQALTWNSGKIHFQLLIHVLHISNSNSIDMGEPQEEELSICPVQECRSARLLRPWMCPGWPSTMSTTTTKSVATSRERNWVLLPKRSSQTSSWLTSSGCLRWSPHSTWPQSPRWRMLAGRQSRGLWGSWSWSPRSLPDASSSPWRTRRTGSPSPRRSWIGWRVKNCWWGSSQENHHGRPAYSQQNDCCVSEAKDNIKPKMRTKHQQASW